MTYLGKMMLLQKLLELSGVVIKRCNHLRQRTSTRAVEVRHKGQWVSSKALGLCVIHGCSAVAKAWGAIQKSEL